MNLTITIQDLFVAKVLVSTKQCRAQRFIHIFRTPRERLLDEFQPNVRKTRFFTTAFIAFGLGLSLPVFIMMTGYEVTRLTNGIIKPHGCHVVGN